MVMYTHNQLSWEGGSQVAQVVGVIKFVILIPLQDSYTAMDVAGAMGHTDVTNLLKKYTHTH